MKNPQQGRINIQLNQIRSILNDFRKTKFKCIELAKVLNQQMPHQERFKNIEKSTLRKMDLLDVSGLVSLKNQLVRALTQMFEIQREMRYQKQKIDARKQIFQNQPDIIFNRQNKLQSAIQSPRNHSNITQKDIQSVLSQPQQRIERKSKNRNLQIPIYRSKNQTNENKLDRISKYIASLKRNMKLNCQTAGYKWKTKQYLMEDPNYLELLSEIEKFQMKEEELDHIFCKGVQKGIRDFIDKAEIIEANSQYKLVKIKKKKSQQKQQNLQQQILSENFNPNLKAQFYKQTKIQKQRIFQPQFESQFQPQFESNFQPQQFFKQKIFLKPILKNSKNEIINRAQEDFNLIKSQLEKANQNYTQIVSKISKTVEKGSEKLIQLRQKRKKQIQNDDDIWHELDNV